MTDRPDDEMEDLAIAARRRITWVRFLAFLKWSGPFVFVAGGVLLAFLRYSGMLQVGIVYGGSLVLAWAAGCGMAALLTRPSLMESLASWDERARRHETFVSAYWFAQNPPLDPGQQLHLAQARARSKEELQQLDDHFPAPVPTIGLIACLLFAGLSATNMFVRSTTAGGAEPVDQASVERAEDTSSSLSEDIEDVDNTEGLTNEEKQKFEEIKKELSKTAEELNDISGKSRRNVLQELERKAKKAENMAASLKNEAIERTSEDMLSELEEYADTAKLARALRNNNPGKAAEEAGKLAEKLKNNQFSIRQRNRLKNALERALENASSDKKKSGIGKHLSSVAEELDNENPKKAGKEMSDMSRRLARLRGRRETREQMETLARKLRSAGRDIFNNRYARRGGIQRLPQQSGKNGKQREKNGQSPKGQSLTGRPGQTSKGGQQAVRRMFGSQPGGNSSVRNGSIPVPGTGSQGGRKPGSGGHIPGPGTGQGDGSNQAAPPIPGSGSTPGSGGNEQTHATGTGQGTRQGSGTGSGPGNSAGTARGGGQGGHRAGTGSSVPGPRKTTPEDATEKRVVNADPSGEGPSSVRRATGTPVNETTRRKANELALDYVNAQEEALDENPLPVSRRQQVLKYFHAIRRHLERNRSKPSDE